MSSSNDYCLVFDLATPWSFLCSLVTFLQCVSLALVKFLTPYVGQFVRTHVMNWNNIGCFVLLLVFVFAVYASINPIRWYYATYFNVRGNSAWMQYERYYVLMTRWGGCLCYAMKTLCECVGALYKNCRVIGYHLGLFLGGVLGFLFCVLAAPFSGLMTIVCLLISIVCLFVAIVYGMCWAFNDARRWINHKYNVRFPGFHIPLFTPSHRFKAPRAAPSNVKQE